MNQKRKTYVKARHAEIDITFDAVIVGAGFAGMYMLHCLRKLGLSCCVFETGGGVGGAAVSGGARERQAPGAASGGGGAGSH